MFFIIFLVAVFSIYFFKVYYLKKPIIINNYFSENKDSVKSFLANKININENQILMEDVGLQINDLENLIIENCYNEEGIKINIKQSFGSEMTIKILNIK